MNKSEFIERLKENKWFEVPQELIDYRLPVVQFFLSNYTNSMLIIDGVQLFTSKINIVYRKEDFTLVNEAYLKIKEKFDKGLIS